MELRTIVMTACLAACGNAVAQQEFSALEQQQISIETKDLFERSNMFSVDFDCLPDEEYSFPLPVG